MLGSTEIRNVKFSKAMGGYKTEEVERLIQKIADDYEEFEDRTKKFQSKIEEMKSELEQLKKEKSSINNVLLSAQQLADKTVADANAEAEKILNEVKEDAEKARADFEAEKNNLINEKNQLIVDTNAEKERINAQFNEFVRNNDEKQKAVLEECRKAVETEQLLYEKLKLTVADFKKHVLSMYSSHIQSIEDIPDEICSDPETVAKAVALSFSEEKSEETNDAYVEENSDTAENDSKTENDSNEAEKKTFFKN